MPQQDSPSRPLTVTVLLCTYRRKDDLARCLSALELQTRLPDEVLLTVRDTDTITLDFLSASSYRLPLRIISVQIPGLVAARNAGIAALKTDIVAMIDDDTYPAANWLENVCQHFAADPKLGGLGGRDRPAGDNVKKIARQPVVGILLYYGKHIGNHHAGIGPARPVDLLKGANMSFRSEAVRQVGFDSRLSGTGSQPCEDLSISLRVRRAGWKLAYDPEVLVDHYEGAREEQRHYAAMLPVKDPKAFGEVTYNWVVTIWDEFSPFRHLVFIAWQFFVGTRVRPGLIQALRFTSSLGSISWQRFWYTQQAVASAYGDLYRARLSGSRT